MAVSSAIWPGPRIPISSTSASVPAGASSTVMGSPISVLRFSRLATVRRRWASIAARMSLVEVLPTEPGDPDHGAAQRAPPRGGQALQGRERVVGGDDGSGLGASRRVGVLGRHEHPPRAAGQRLRREAPAVDVLADEPDEEVAGAGRARVDHGARRAAGMRRRAPRAARRRPARPAQATTRARSASRATATSSKGTVRPSSNSW